MINLKTLRIKDPDSAQSEQSVDLREAKLMKAGSSATLRRGLGSHGNLSAALSEEAGETILSLNPECDMQRLNAYDLSPMPAPSFSSLDRMVNAPPPINLIFSIKFPLFNDK